MVKPSESLSGRESGRRTNFLSTLSNLLHKSRDIGKRVSRFLCNEFAVRGEGGKRAVKAAVERG